MLHSPIRFTLTLTLLQLLLVLASMLYLFCMFSLCLAHKRYKVITHTPINRHARQSQLRSWILPLTFLLCFLRCSTLFVAVCFLQKPDSSNTDQRIVFIEYILLDLPTIVVNSIYALMVLVYIETFLQTRLHTDHISPKHWSLYFLLFPLALIIRQFICYTLGTWAISTHTLLFQGIPALDHYRNVLYSIEIGDCSFGLALHLFFYLFLNIHFAGYPIRSTNSSHRRMGTILILWAISRWIWLIAVVLVYRYRIDILSESTQPMIHPILLFLALIGCEICPIITTIMTYSSTVLGSDSPPPVPSHIDLSEEDLFWPLDDSVLSADPRIATGGLHSESLESSVGPQQIQWIDYIIRNSETAFMEDEITPTTTTISDEGRPLLLL